MNKNVQTFIGCDSEYEGAKLVLFGAPFDGTTSFRPGARFGPGAARSESFGLEDYSPYQDKSLLDLSIFDAGDLEFPFGDPSKALDMIKEFTGQVADDGKLPVMIGGEHLVTLGAVSAIAAKYPDLRIVHFDAHADLRDDYLGEKLSHATVMRRIWELVGDGRIYQLGIRSGDREEFRWAKGHVYTGMFDCSHIDYVVDKLGDYPVYVTIDLDVIDPSAFSGTGTPEAGGIKFTSLLQSILKLSGRNIVGADVCELSPHYDPSGVSTATTCKVLRELMLSIAK